MARLVTLIPQSIRRALKERFVRIELSRPYEVIIDPAHRPLADKVAVVTGASGAIGRAITIRLALDGARVVAIGRDEIKLRGLVAEVASLGGQAQWESLDLSNAAEIRALSERVGLIDILVNNAGGSSRSKSTQIWNQSVDTIDEVLSVNLRATMLMVAACGGKIIEGGRIVNLGSTVGLGGLSKFSEYAAAKAGVVGFTRSAALEFGAKNITVNCVSPGIVQREHISHKVRENTLRKAVLPELGRAEDVAEMVGFLVGPRAGWITGQEFVVDGGRSLGLHGEP